jgi:hypothetical protein
MSVNITIGISGPDAKEIKQKINDLAGKRSQSVSKFVVECCLKEINKTAAK